MQAPSKKVRRCSSVSVSAMSSSCPSTSRILYIRSSSKRSRPALNCAPNDDPRVSLQRVVDRSHLVDDIAMKVRDAVPECAIIACQVVRRSIAELCVADHRNDPAILERWLSNRTPEIFRSWIRPGSSLLVAAEDDNILAAGSVTDAGEIALNYVSPDARFRGVSATLLDALECRAIERGVGLCTLKSTETARRFYLARNYSEADPQTANSAQRLATR